MGRTRKTLRMAIEGQQHVCRFKHPITGKTTRINLGPASIAKKNFEALNRVFLDRHCWPDGAGLPDPMRYQWLGIWPGLISSKQRQSVCIPCGPDPNEDYRVEDLKEFELQQRIAALEATIKAKDKELEHWRGKKLGLGPSPTLASALSTFKERYTGRDANHTKNVLSDLGRFVKHFKGEKTTVEEMEGREVEIDAWLRGLTKTVKPSLDDQPNAKAVEISIGAERRKQIRRHVLKFLTDSGAIIDRKKIASVKRDEVRADRGAIRWLSEQQAKTVAAKLEKYRGLKGMKYAGLNAVYWSDLFRLQTLLGLRPDELITIKKSDISEGFEFIQLSLLRHLTLKQGSRRIKLPPEAVEILKRRLAFTEYCFPDPRTNQPWADAKRYDKHYNAALNWAATAAGIPFRLDCRTGRRTFASLAIRAGMSVEKVAAIMGDNPATVREHYAAILPHEVDPAQANISLEPVAATA